MGRRKSGHPRIWRVFSLSLGSVLLLFGLWAFGIEPNRLVIHSENLSLKSWPPELNGLRIAVIGDIHAGSLYINEAKLNQIVSLTNSQQPDLIVLLGDFMVQNGFFKTEVEPEKIAASLKDFRAKLGVFAVLGNHDWWFNGQRVRKALDDVGIRVIDNQALPLEKDGHQVWLVGLGDAWTGGPKVKETFARVPVGAPNIVLTHNPDLFPQLPNSTLLLLAAHTHGGQVNLPVVGRLVVPSNYGQRFAAGVVKEDGKTLFVTTGIGTSIFPVRFRVPPEIVMLTIDAE